MDAKFTLFSSEHNLRILGNKIISKYPGILTWCGVATAGKCTSSSVTLEGTVGLGEKSR